MRTDVVPDLLDNGPKIDLHGRPIPGTRMCRACETNSDQRRDENGGEPDSPRRASNHIVSPDGPWIVLSRLYNAIGSETLATLLPDEVLDASQLAHG